MIAIVSGILLAFHLLCMNVCSAGPLLCIWLNRKASSLESKTVGLRLAWVSFWTLPVGIVIGLALGLLAMALGDRDFADVLPQFSYKIKWGIAEVICSLVWSFGYWAWAKWRPPKSFFARVCHAGLAVLTATNLLYHFPPLMTVMSNVAVGDMVLEQPIDAASFRTLMYTQLVMAHVVHIWLASIAVSGVSLILLARGLEHPRPFHLFGSRVALIATIAQFASGFWLLVAVPPQTQSMLLGGNLWATGLLVLAVAAAFHLLQNLAGLALGDDEKGAAKKVVQMTIVTVVLMSCALQVIR